MASKRHWSWEGRNEAEQIRWERDLFCDHFDAQSLRLSQLEARMFHLEAAVKLRMAIEHAH